MTSVSQRRFAEVLLVVLGVGLFYLPLLDPARMQSGGDFANLFWPIKVFRGEVIAASGALPLWNPYIFMGSPLAATLQHAIFYPIDYLFFPPGVRGMFFGALNLYVLCHNILCGVGVWWMLRRGLGCGAAGSIIAGIVFPCTAWFWGGQEHINQVGTVAWMPWMAGVAFLFARGRLRPPRFVALYSALGAMQFLVGHPQAAFYTHVFVGMVLLVAGLAFRSRHRLRRTATLLVSLGMAGGLLGVIVAMQLLPALELSKMSYRQFQEGDTSYSLSYSMPPDLLLTYFQPNRFGDYLGGYPDQRAYNEYGLHVGWATMLLAVVGAGALLRGRRHRRVLAISAIAGIPLALMFALGGNASIGAIAQRDFTEFPAPALRAPTLVMEYIRAADPDMLAPRDGIRWSRVSPHELLVTVVSPAQGFRVPARISILATMLWVILAAFGVQAILAWLAAKHSRAPIIAAFAMGAVAWLALFVPSTGEKFRHPKVVSSAADPSLIDFVEHDRLLRETTSPSIPASLDGRIFRLTLDDLNLTVAERQRSAEEPWEARFGGHGIEHRWWRLMENNNAAVQWPSVEGYEEGLLPTVRTKDFLFAYNRHLRQARPDPMFAELLGIGTIFSDLPVDESLYPPRANGVRNGHGLFHATPGGGAAAFWFDQASGIDFAALEGPFYRGGAPHGNRQNDLLDYGSAPRWAENWPRITTDVTNPNEVILRAEGDSVPGDAVLSMGWAHGWICTRTGQPIEWLGAVHALIPAESFDESATARIAYRPASFRMGMFLSLLGTGGWCVLLVATGGNGKRRRKR